MKKKSLGFWIGLVAVVGGAFVFWVSSGIGQMPPDRLTRQEITRPNPLRAVDTPVPVPTEIRQASLQSDDAPLSQVSQAVNLDIFAAAPAQPAAPAAPVAPVQQATQPLAFSPSSPIADPFSAPMFAPEAPAIPTPLAEPGSGLASPVPANDVAFAFPGTETTATVDLNPAHALATAPAIPQERQFLVEHGRPTNLAEHEQRYSSASSLSSADPFAAQQPEAAVPMHTPLSVAQPTAQHMAASTMRTAAIPTPPPMAASPQPPNEGTGLPGASSLNGLQTPHLTLQKVMPEEIVLNQPATLKTVIHNVGNSVARNVTITDRVPQGTRLVSTVPEAVFSPDGELRWSIGNIEPSVEFIVEMRVLPLREGEIGSVAMVTHSAEASGRITVTRPMLAVEVRAPAEVRLGETANVEIIVSNPGTATVRNVVVEERVPEGLFHRDGRIMRHEGITSLRPRETRTLTLPLLCVGGGNLVNHVIVTADGDLMVEDRTTIRALAPILNLEIVGARNRFLERRSEYRLIIANRGNASARNVALELVLPAAVQFVSTNQSGVYEPSTHTVHWALEELPAQEAGEIELVIIPAQIGEHSLRFVGVGENNLRAEATLPVSIDGIAAITFDISGDSNLVEVGKDVVYEIRIANRGTKAAENVKVRVALPEGMSFVRAEGGRTQVAQGGIINFETLSRLAPNGEHIFKLSARCQTEGDHRVNVQVISDDLRSPITREESTRVFR